MNNQNSNSEFKNSRRQFLKSTSGVLFCLSLPFGLSTVISCQEEKNQKSLTKLQRAGRGKGQEVSIWVQIHENDTLTIFNPTNEMGQGSMTALAVLIAEELDADWSKVHLEHSPVDADSYGAPGRRGNSMMTVGSRTVTGYFDILRQAGAQARYVLISNVAKHWNVPINELTTEPNKVVHQKTNKRISYGEITSFLKPLEEIPEIPLGRLKKANDFRLIGKVANRFDIPSKVDGSAMYAIDVQITDMVYGVISRSPVNGSSPELKNEEVIRDMNGVLDIVKLKHGIGITASTIEQALKAKKELQIVWSTEAKAESHTSEDAYTEYNKVASSNVANGNVVLNEGNFQRAYQTAAKTYSSDYKNDYICHAQMEPLNAIVSIAKDNSSAEVWVGTQAPSRNQSTVAKMLGIDKSKVTIHRQYLGGGFGRRATSDWVEEAVQLAQATKRTVKLIWTREDDIQYGMFRPMSLQRIQAGVDQVGNITSWQHTIVGTGGGLLATGAKSQYYTLPNQHIEVRNIDHGVRTKHWRGVGHGPNKFAIEAFIGELAADQNIDPFDFRMQLMKNHPRAQKVLQTVADMANWKKSPAPQGRGKGIAFAERSGSLAACVCELSVNREDGTIKVHNLWASLDAGVVVQPDNVIAQMEGGLIMGISSVLKERITFKKGIVQQSNFHDYSILRMNEVPESIKISIIPSTEKPTGVGESAIPIIGGAIANAFASLTGKRIRHLPFTQKKVLEVLKS